MNLPTIYNITDEFIQTFEQLQSMKEELTPESIENTLGGLSQLTAQNLGACLKEIETTVARMKEYEATMQERRKKLEKELQAYYQYIADGMVKCGYKKMFCPEFSISIRNNPEFVKISKDAIIPKDYHRVKIEVDKIAIKRALKQGVKIEGVELQRSKRVVIE